MDMPEKEDKTAKLFQNVNSILTQEIEKLSQENSNIEQMIQENKQEEAKVPSMEPEMQRQETKLSSMEPEVQGQETKFSSVEPEIQRQEAAEELPEVATTPEELFKDDDISEQIESARRLMEQEGDKEILPSIQVPEDVLEDEEIITHLTEAQKEIFSYFIPIQGMEQQICQVLTGVKKRRGRSITSAEGNIIVQGGPGSGKTVLATDLIKVIHQETKQVGGKVGKIEASSLNQKDIPDLLKKVRGGCLIIEKAGDITRETAVKMALQMSQDTAGMLVILEDTKEGIRKALGRDEEFAKKFTERINIPIFSIDELVEFAKSYAGELDYEIDEMGILALYNRISSIEKLDEATTLFEVKDIVDEAVANSEKGGFKKAFSLFSSKRSGQSDGKILREKDFEE